MKLRALKSKTVKVCRHCKVEQPINNFGFYHGRRYSLCKACDRVLAKERYNKRRRKPLVDIKNLEGEEWRPIFGWEDRYQISNMGRVKSLFSGEKLMSASQKQNGYIRVTLNRDHKNKDYYVHRLVAEAFIPNPNNLPEVNHRFGNKMDNRVTELEWSNRSLNNKHAYQELGRVSTFKDKCGRQNPRSRPLIAIDLSTNNQSEFESIRLASKALGISHSLIYDVLSGRQKKSHGFTFIDDLNKLLCRKST